MQIIGISLKCNTLGIHTKSIKGKFGTLYYNNGTIHIFSSHTKRLLFQTRQDVSYKRLIQLIKEQLYRL